MPPAPTTLLPTVPAYRRLWGFVAASVATHALLLAALFALLRPALLAPKLGDPIGINVEITAIAPIDTLTLVRAESPLTLMPLLPALPQPLPLPRMREMVKVEGEAPGAPTPVAPSVDPTPIDVIGRVVVGPVVDLARLPPSDAARVRQSFAPNVHREPQLAGSLAVPYPTAALRLRSEGRVLVLVSLDAEGQITDAKTFPEPSVFGPSVLAALKGARFRPALLDDKPVPYWTMLEFVFTIAGEAPAIDAAKR
jgi:TonB family protein